MSVYSAGVGRSGTFIAVDAMMQRLKEKDDINIYEFLYSMRCDRPFMIQNVVSCWWLSNMNGGLLVMLCVCVCACVRACVRVYYSGLGYCHSIISQCYCRCSVALVKYS